MQTDTFYDAFPNSATTAAILKSFDSADADAVENSRKRMENYFNCVDDYSWGGLCDRAADEYRAKRSAIREALKEQENSGKPFTDVFAVPVLCDLSGKVLTERIVDGKFGCSWIIEGENGERGTFVSIAKKQSTYNKKGYLARTKKVSVEYYYTGRITTKGNLDLRARITNVEFSDALTDVVSSYVCRILYIASLSPLKSAI